MRHVMLDLETLGVAPGCVIRSIGAVVFDPRGIAWGATFYQNVDKQSCLTAGMTVNPSTEAWWAKQSQDAQTALEINAVPLRDALMGFSQWFNTNLGQYVWSHGATFDIPILAAAFGIGGFSDLPWKYPDARDTRTLYDIAAFDPKSVPAIGTSHNALDDAKFQAVCVQRAFSKIKPNY